MKHPPVALLLLGIALCVGCATSAQRLPAPEASTALDEPAPKASTTPLDPLLAQHLAEAEGVRTTWGLDVSQHPTHGTWTMRIRRDGGGSASMLAHPSYNPPGVFDFDEVLRRVAPSLRREQRDEDQHSVTLQSGAGAVRYYTSDAATILELFETVRPWITEGELAAWERSPPAHLPEEQEEGDEAAMLARHIAEAEGAILVNTGGESAWSLRVDGDGGGRIAYSLRGGNAVPAGTYDLAELLRRLEPSLRRDRREGDAYSILLLRGQAHVRYYTSDAEGFREMLEEARPWFPTPNRLRFERLFADGVPDVPFGDHIRAIADHVDERWPELSHEERWQYDQRAYGPLLAALGDHAGKHRVELSASARARHIARAYEFLVPELQEQRLAFQREVFEAVWFQESTSAYHDAVVDLWQRYEQADIPVPAADLLGLNQPGMGQPGGQQFHLTPLRIANQYLHLSDPLAAAEWYEKVPVSGLGPLRAADAYFEAGEVERAGALYAHILDSLDDWLKLQERLRGEPRHAVREPLERADLEAVEKHVRSRLNEIQEREGP